MQYPLNKYGEIEISQNEIQYTIPISYTDANELDEIEKAYREKGKELLNNPLYLFADDLQVIRNRFSFTFHLEQMKAFHYIRQLHFEEQIYYFQSLIEMARNVEHTPVLWDKHSMLVDLTDKKIKTFVFAFNRHPLYSTQTAIDGLKEMILLSLTTLQRVLGKPRRIDFIDQREKVILFAEMVLRAKDIVEIEQNLNTTILEIEKELEVAREQQEELKNKGFITRFKESRKAKKEVASSKERDLPTFTEKQFNQIPGPDEEKKKPFWDNKFFFIGASVFAVIILIASALGIFEPSSKSASAEPPAATEPKEENKKEKKKENNQISSDELANIYRMAIIGEEVAALKKLEHYGYENLNEKDKIVMLRLYKNTGQYKKLIELDSSYTEEIIDELITANKPEELKALKGIDNPLIAFEIAYIEQEWEKVIQFKDNVELIERRQQQVLTAYLQLKKIDEAKQFAAAQENPALEKMVQDFQEAQEDQEEQVSQEEEKKN